MSWDEVTRGTSRLIWGDMLQVLPTFADASVQLIVVDPPYGNVKKTYLGERLAWDRQWPTQEAYLGWLRQAAKEWRRVLMPNGSLYCFASPQMAAYVEVMLGEVFRVLNRLTWRKPPFATKAEMFEKEALRSYFPASEAILFAEQYGSDGQALGESGYARAEQGLKTSLFSTPIAEAMQETQTTAKQVTEAIGAYGKVNHGGAVSNWLLGYNIPTRAQYEAMRSYFNSLASQEYAYLRQEYEDLRQEYEDLRRPFTVSAAVPYTDVWDFATVSAGTGKHPCEKPLPLLRHMITVSSRPGDTVLDCCAGSFATLVAAKQLGRYGIGIEQEKTWYQHGISRLSQEELFLC